MCVCFSAKNWATVLIFFKDEGESFSGILYKTKNSLKTVASRIIVKKTPKEIYFKNENTFFLLIFKNVESIIY
jgi:hypothetical protein